jgi:periplasmic protein TonB
LRKYSYSLIASRCSLLADRCLKREVGSFMEMITFFISRESIAMTNKELLQANLLDIIFEHRNKNYGAYALRKNYPHRLKVSVVIAVALSSLLFFVTILKKDSILVSDSKGEVIIRDILPDNPKQEQQPRRTQRQTATVHATEQIQFTNEQTNMPEQGDFENALPSDHTQSGEAPVLDTASSQPATGNSSTVTETPQPEFRPSHKEAEFPGGKDAFARFLQMRLETPDDLEPGAKLAVVVRFMVDVDGSISKTEIVQSGGERFDKEVIRVLKKMPKWIPAEQNQIKVPVYFTQVVTFVGAEQ